MEQKNEKITLSYSTSTSAGDKPYRVTALTNRTTPTIGTQFNERDVTEYINTANVTVEILEG